MYIAILRTLWAHSLQSNVNIKQVQFLDSNLMWVEIVKIKSIQNKYNFLKFHNFRTREYLLVTVIGIREMIVSSAEFVTSV